MWKKCPCSDLTVVTTLSPTEWSWVKKQTWAWTDLATSWAYYQHAKRAPFGTENGCFGTYYTILHNDSSSVCDRKQVCVHWLHNPSSYTVRVLLSVTLSTQSYATGVLVWLADIWDCESSGRWFGSCMWQGEGSFLCINLQSALGPVCIKDPMSTCE